ncbi:hypothetical protein C8R43DRAFT_1018598 [Mycena crocata]|nr:hypothetical protein C8R43DRAFT_1018598 [Mycena crocata]
MCVSSLCSLVLWIYTTPLFSSSLESTLHGANISHRGDSMHSPSQIPKRAKALSFSRLSYRPPPRPPPQRPPPPRPLQCATPPAPFRATPTTTSRLSRPPRPLVPRPPDLGPPSQRSHPTLREWHADHARRTPPSPTPTVPAHVPAHVAHIRACTTPPSLRAPTRHASGAALVGTRGRVVAASFDVLSTESPPRIG